MGLLLIRAEERVAPAIPIAVEVTVPTNIAMLVRSRCQLISYWWHACC